MPANCPRHRMLLASLLAPAVSLALAGCGGEEPLAPAESLDPATPAGAIAPAGGDLAALTTGRIVFMSYRYNNWPNVYTMDPSGGGVTRLSGWKAEAKTPAWSYDNKQIAVVMDRVVNNENVADIYLMNADGSHKHWARPVPSSDFTLTEPSWSPDGTHLLVTVTLQGGSFLAKLTLATGALDFVSLPAGGPAGDQPSYDPTGKKILYVGQDGHTVERINADGSGHATLFSNQGALFFAPKYSPDGKRILFAKVASGKSYVYVKNADGTVRRLTTTGTEGVASWSPDGSKISFESQKSGDGQVYVMSSNGGTATRISHSATIDGDPAFSH